MKAKEKAGFALEDTLAVYGIRKNPFPIDDTDDFFFSTPMLAKQIDALRNLVEYGDLLLVISGVEGAGKTTFLNQFLLAADKRWKCCLIDARAATTISSLVDELLGGFGLKVRGDDAQGDEAVLRAHLTDLHANGDIVMLAVDDAHLLPQICTEFLLGLVEERGQIELRLLLATEPGRLGFPTNDTKRVHVVVLQPFDIQQSGDYLHTRLSHAGLVGDSPFNVSVVEDIHQDSGGLPGAIHPLALHTLLANTDTSLLGRRASKPTRAIVYLVAALVIGGGVVVFLRSEPGFEPVVANDPGTTGKVQGRVTGVTAGSGGGDESRDGRADPEATDSERQVARSAEPDESRDGRAEPFTRSVTATAPAKKADVAAPSIVTVQTGSEAKVFTLDEGGASTTAAVTVTSPAPSKDPEPAASLASKITPIASAPVKSHAAHDLNWLRKQDPSHYVIQLVGTRDSSAVGKFLDNHKLGSKGAWFVTSHENKPWFVVVYGMYPDNASAKAAIKTLPEGLRAGSPWPRSVASVVDSAR